MHINISVLNTSIAFLFGIVMISSLMNFRAMDDTRHVEDSLEVDRKRHLSELLATIKGKEKRPADSVFKNVTVLKGMPAQRMLAIMNIAYSRSLGVSCGHCHNTTNWESDEKKEKQITRDMIAMTRRINTELLVPIKKDAVVNCTTCHRGQRKPALDLEQAKSN